MDRLTELLRNDMKPALGVTEPGAIAFAVATAKKYTDGEVQKIEVALNSGMYKNAFTCGIPNSRRYGNLYAAALGAVAAQPELGLESLAHITPEDDDKAALMVADGKVQVWMDKVDSRISIDAAVITEKDTCTVRIRDSHTRITEIVKNGEIIFKNESPDNIHMADEETDGENTAPIDQYTIHELLEYVKNVPEKDISFVREAFSMNMDLVEDAVHSDRAVITRQLLKENDHKIISEDAQRTAQLLCTGAIEARVLGFSKPAMSVTGSGAHGIIATMPLFAYFQVNYKVVDDDLLLRATALCHLITMYIKEYSGKLSAFCGCAIAAGTGMACGLAFLRGASEKQIDMVIRNMASGMTGMICDGGNHGCAVKAMTAVDAAFRAVNLAMNDVSIETIHGINGRTPEDTMKYMGMIASPGMTQTEKTIVEIMEKK